MPKRAMKEKQELPSARACLQKAFHNMCVTICGRFHPDKGAVAGCGNRIRVKFPAKWGVHIAGMIFQTRSKHTKRNLRRNKYSSDEVPFFTIILLLFPQSQRAVSINEESSDSVFMIPIRSPSFRVILRSTPSVTVMLPFSPSSPMIIKLTKPFEQEAM